MFSLKDWQSTKDWQNWTGYVKSTPEQKFLPKTIEELQQIVKDARTQGKTIRVTGAAHSFSGCACPEHFAISLHHLRGIVSVNKDKQWVTVYAGTYLHELGDMLRSHGFALENMGDIQNQSIAGAICTGTHGTGLSLGSVSSQVVAWQWVDGRGEVQQHQRGDDDLSKSLHVSLGMLGIFTQVTLKVMPLYGLHESSCSIKFEQALVQFPQVIQQERHMEWFLFPGTDQVQQKILKVIEPKPMSKLQKFKDHFEGVVILNGVFFAMSELARKNPKYVKVMSKFSADNIPNTVREGYSYEVFPKPRGVKFDESEYFIALTDFDQCIRFIQKELMQDTKGSHFPIEVRPHKGEIGFLSPTQGRDSVALSFHVYKGINSKPFFAWVKSQMQRWQGRPHWGKVSHLNQKEVQALYPDLAKFLAVRKQYDPDGVFLNPWLREKFGL
ncbi:D-arabinono-1,4-lactone oxidase [Acinetobacter sp. c2-A9]|uniref:D-arabinono-1,4-lactone oxidase n=1 Tax=Acinetobacter sp. c2-A9 TaxID=3342802 RepID=UPI0035BA5CB8